MRVRVDEPRGLDGDLRSLRAEVFELLREARVVEARGVRAEDHDRLLGERLHDLGGEALAHAGRELHEPVGETRRSQLREVRWSGMALQEISDRGVIEVRTEDSFECWMDLGEQAPDAVAGGGDLSCEVVVEAAEHAQFRDLLVRELNRPAGVRERAGGLRDDGRVSRAPVGSRPGLPRTAQLRSAALRSWPADRPRTSASRGPSARR